MLLGTLFLSSFSFIDLFNAKSYTFFFRIYIHSFLIINSVTQTMVGNLSSWYGIIDNLGLEEGKHRWY